MFDSTIFHAGSSQRVGTLRQHGRERVGDQAFPRVQLEQASRSRGPRDRRAASRARIPADAPSIASPTVASPACSRGVAQVADGHRVLEIVDATRSARARRARRELAPRARSVDRGSCWPDRAAGQAVGEPRPLDHRGLEQARRRVGVVLEQLRHAVAEREVHPAVERGVARAPAALDELARERREPELGVAAVARSRARRHRGSARGARRSRPRSRRPRRRRARSTCPRPSTRRSPRSCETPGPAPRRAHASRVAAAISRRSHQPPDIQK